MIPGPQFEKLKQYFSRHKPTIQEIVREQTSGGIIYRRNKSTNDVEILLIQDAKDRWTIPKGHVEPDEPTQDTAVREIREEVGLQEMEVICWLGKINFRYRRQQSLVLMTMQIYLIRGEGNTNELKKEEWINGVGWYPFQKAINMIEYEDIGKLMLLAMKKIRDDRR